jgi:hypothetical protein
MKARACQIESFSFNDNLRINLAKDKEQQEIKKLTTELANYKNASPVLALAFNDAEAHGDFIEFKVNNHDCFVSKNESPPKTRG